MSTTVSDKPSGTAIVASLRLSKALGRTPESWLAMQYNHDLWQARQHVDLGGVTKLRFRSA